MIQPLTGKILVRRLPEETKKGELYIPDEAREKPMEGVVLNVGTDVKSVSANDQVLFGKYSGTEVLDETEVLVILEEKDILGKRI